jgi:acyl-CoA thioesterase FadM
MPARRRWNTSVRLCELDQAGQAQPFRMMEWFQEAAAYASTLGGFPPERYVQMGAAWFIRDVQLSILRAPRYGEAIEVETWVSDLRRFRTRREYLLRAGEEIVARGQADWLYLERDPKSGKIKPRHPDEEMKTAFAREPATAISPERVLNFGPALETPKHLSPRRVHPHDIDAQGHANHTVYGRWLEDLALELEPDTRMAELRIEYLADAKVGEQLQVGWQNSGERYIQWIERDGQRLARAEVRRGPPDATSP